MITGFYAALMAFGLIFLIFSVVVRRRSLQVSLGDGGYQELERYIRAHANFTETVPMALLLLLILEISATAFWLLHVLGIMILASRILHYLALTKPPTVGYFRVAGMGLMIGVYSLAGMLLVLKFFGVMAFMQVLPL